MGNLEHEIKSTVLDCCSVTGCTRSVATIDEDLCDLHLEEMVLAMAEEHGYDEFGYNDGGGK